MVKAMAMVCTLVVRIVVVMTTMKMIVFNNNLAPSRALIGRDLCSIRVQTMEMTRSWRNFLVACEFPRNVNGNGRQKLLLKKQIDNNFP